MTDGPVSGFPQKGVLTPTDELYVVNNDGIAASNRFLASALVLAMARSPAEIAAIVTPSDYRFNPGDVRRYGADISASDNSAAINTAILVASNADGPKAVIPAGLWRCTSDVVMRPNVILEGVGRNSHLEFNGAMLSLDNIAASTHLNNWTIRDIQVSRIGTAGTAVLLEGDLTDGDVIRFTIKRFNISSSTGDGLTMRGTYIGDVWSPLIRNCAGNGLVMENDTTTNSTAVNAVNFYGGEIQNNGIGVQANEINGINFFGTTIEGNNVGAVDLERRCTSIHFWNCWFEGNDGFDIRIGNVVTSPRQSQNIGFHGCLFSDSSSGKTHAIELISVAGFVADNCYSNGYSTSFVRNSQAGGGAVRGWVRDYFSSDSSPAIDSPNEYLKADDYSPNQTPNEAVSAAGAVSLITKTTFINSGSGSMAITLADGAEDQEKFLLMTVDGGDATLTFGGGFYPNAGSIVFNDVGDFARLWFRNGRWIWLGGTATLVTSGSGAYTRATTVVEDRALLASASATTLNNNNVLAALIADLQAKGIVR